MTVELYRHYRYGPRNFRECNMDLLFLEARPIPSHALMALLAVLIGGVQLMSAKGTSQHKVLGYIWVSLMCTSRSHRFSSPRFSCGVPTAQFISSVPGLC